MVYRILYVSRNVSNVIKRVTNLLDLIEASDHKIQIKFISRMNLGKPSGLA